MAEQSPDLMAMAIRDEGQRAALLERYCRLKSALSKQLDDVTSASGPASRDSLRQTLVGCCYLAEEYPLPAAVHYLLDCDPETLKPDPTEGRGVAVVNLLREIARDEDIEVFCTVLEFGPGHDARLVRMTDHHGNDIHEFFASEKPEFLLDSPKSPEGEVCIKAGVTILPTSRVLEIEVNSGQTEDDSLRLLENLLCYVADRVLVKADVNKAFTFLCEFANGLEGPRHPNCIPFRWPRRPLDKGMINAITVGYLPFFVSRAAAYHYEPSIDLFEGIATGLRRLPPSRLGVDSIVSSLDSLLGSVEPANLLPALRCVDALMRDDGWPGRPDYISQWLRFGLLRTHYKLETWFRTDDAAVFVEICMAFPNSDLDAILHGLLIEQSKNYAFCFALMVQILRVPADSGLGKIRPRLWAFFEDLILITIFVRDIVMRKSSYGVLPRFPKASSWHGWQSFFQPMHLEIVALVGETVDQLSQNPGGWWDCALKGLLEWAEAQICSATDDSDEFTAFWLPLLLDLSRRGCCRFSEPGAQPSRSDIRDLFRSVLHTYLDVCVGAEPRRRDFGRPGLSVDEGGDACASCSLLGGFLVDRSRVRAIFPIARTGVAARTSSAGHALQQSTLSHVLPLLGSTKRNCVFHIKDSTMGTVLCVQKRNNERLWEDWSRRRHGAAQELARFDHEKMKLILGENDHKALFGMEFGSKILSKERRQMLEGLLKHKIQRRENSTRYHQSRTTTFLEQERLSALGRTIEEDFESMEDEVGDWAEYSDLEMTGW